MEGYLAHKWGLEGDLPTGHTYKSSSPISPAGWAIERASTENKIALKMEGAGGEFSSDVPINDNDWHHLVTTLVEELRKFMLTALKLPPLHKPDRSPHPIILLSSVNPFPKERSSQN